MSHVVTDSAPATLLADECHHVTGRDDDYDGLLAMVGDRRVVLIGEGSHGTREFYRERARITRRLIDECGFTIVAVEADWPDAHRVDRFVCADSPDRNSRDALSGFRRFPAWMWRNVEVLEFVDWLRRHNDQLPAGRERVHFCGLDLYSLRTSIEAVIAYLDANDPDEARRARERYACFDHVGADGQAYGFALAHQRVLPCEDEVVAQLLELRRRSEQYLSRDGVVAEDRLFDAEQNAVLVRDAEEYYHQMYRADVSSWNLRDRHMAATVDALLRYHGRRSGTAKIVIWEHNSHIGDARATAMSARGELNVGQLVRQRYGVAECLLVGLTTFDGTVTAADDWGGPARRWRVRPALPGSHEELLHQIGVPAFWLSLTSGRARDVLAARRRERAIGVIYRPRTELQSHYFVARMAGQFDVVVHIDRTHALEPLDTTPLWEQDEPPETYPTGL